MTAQVSLKVQITGRDLDKYLIFNSSKHVISAKVLDTSWLFADKRQVTNANSSMTPGIPLHVLKMLHRLTTETVFNLHDAIMSRYTMEASVQHYVVQMNSVCSKSLPNNLYHVTVNHSD